MDFFGKQDAAKRDSFILLCVFIVAMLVFGWLIQLVATGVAFVFALFTGIKAGEYNFIVVAAAWLYVAYACFKRWRDISQGGPCIAKSFGAVRVTHNKADAAMKQLLRVNAEMAIASSTTELPCFVMPEEKSINAFVLGKQKKPALVVTQGLLESLERDELSAVIGHEYGHITNKDLNLNMRLLIVLGGLNSIDELGQSMMAFSTSLLIGSRSRSRNTFWGEAIFCWCLGLLLIIFGSTLVFFGELLKAGFSRKREFLADAKSAQYTREPSGLAKVLHRFNGEDRERALDSHYSRELEHICFQGASMVGFMSGWMASHPPVQDRLDAVDPHYAIKQRALSRNEGEKQKAADNRDDRTRVAGPAGFVATVAATSAIASAASTPSIISIDAHSEELSIVLSAMVHASGYSGEKAENNYKRLLRSYTMNEHPYLEIKGPEQAKLLNNALTVLVQHPAVQRQAWIDHLQEIMAADKIKTPEEVAVFDFIVKRLNPPADAA